MDHESLLVSITTLLRIDRFTQYLAIKIDYVFVVLLKVQSICSKSFCMYVQPGCRVGKSGEV